MDKSSRIALSDQKLVREDPGREVTLISQVRCSMVDDQPQRRPWEQSKDGDLITLICLMRLLSYWVAWLTQPLNVYLTRGCFGCLPIPACLPKYQSCANRHLLWQRSGNMILPHLLDGHRSEIVLVMPLPPPAPKWRHSHPRHQLTRHQLKLVSPFRSSASS